jgi:hypothetical protein
MEGKPKGLTLPMNCRGTFLFLAGHAQERQRVAIALHKAVQLQAERLCIQPIGLYPPVLLIQLLRTDHVALDPQRT